MVDDYWLFVISANKCFISHVRNLGLERCYNDWPRIKLGALEIKYTYGAFPRQVLCLFYYIPCDRIGGRHLVLFRFHYLKKGSSCAEPFVGFVIRHIKGISRAPRKRMSTTFSYMVLSSCTRAWRATAATSPRFCDTGLAQLYRDSASLNKE